ncbi:MAG: 2-amino-4-hydroxy-6-hydroxymethyldihydropteridine diphosphokinase [Fermentimonas sp.]|jgi:2-amino-4-hydroxy-6-hydroxymethyldihydropteridine diphosphokinase
MLEQHYLLYLSIGSNLGNREENIDLAIEKIEMQIGEVVSRSAFYYSEAQGFESDNDFVNIACEVSTSLDIYEAFAETQSIEKGMGRTNKSKNGVHEDRIIDIDIVLAGSCVIDTDYLTIPHPRMAERDFVLVPLSEIAPDVVHPIFNKTILELRNTLKK